MIVISKQDSPSSFFENFKRGLTDDIHTCMLCKINKYDHKKMKAEVIPLNKYRNKNDSFDNRTLLIEVPIMHLKVRDFYIRPPYKKGDIVIVLFFDEDTDNAILTGDIEETNSTRRHSTDDAVIIGNIRTFEKAEYIGEHEEDLLITNTKDNFKIVVKEDGEINIKSDKKISIDSKEQVTITGPSGTSSW